MDKGYLILKRTSASRPLQRVERRRLRRARRWRRRRSHLQGERRIRRTEIMPSLTDSGNKITICDSKADGTYLGRISDCGWPSASRNA
jgi:hypothetical protein